MVILSYILLELSLFNSFHKGGLLCHVLVYSGVGLQVLPFIDNSHLGEHFSLPSNSLLSLLHVLF